MEHAEEQDSWRRAVGNIFNCFDRKKAQQLHDDVLCMSHDLKPALLLDYLKPEVKSLHKLLNSVPIRAPLKSQWTILRYNEEVFLGNFPQITSQVLNDTIAMVDVTTTVPTVMEDETTAVMCREVSEWLEKTTFKLQGCNKESCAVIEAPISPTLNPCTVYGWLLGYPVVYWFDEERGYQLGMVELVRNVVTATNQAHSVSPATQLLWQNEHPLYSFTVPVSILPQVKGHIQDWFRQLQARAGTHGIMLILTEQTICHPSLVL